ncbi:glutaredoxin family protein [Marinobacter sp. F3R11]|uniref:glutaredoxin family protein n=1 Tax=Marinobacter sp. F3R11 TaxID=2267231 RepID=UPI000DEB7D7D|nr:glutaredoxin [Marinobacter sp. F3R11]RBW49755.1 glutaredoxin [Marinobacter sp. F3R11]
MRMVIRFFFRTLRLILTPFVLLSEKLGNGRPLERSPAEQQEADAACEQLVLYQFKTCPFCVKVRKQIARLNLKIEKRDAQHNETHRAELEQGGGQVKVPCLRISNPDGSETWMYESSDINAWLEQRFGKAA